MFIARRKPIDKLLQIKQKRLSLLKSNFKNASLIPNLKSEAPNQNIFSETRNLQSEVPSFLSEDSNFTSETQHFLSKTPPTI